MRLGTLRHSPRASAGDDAACAPRECGAANERTARIISATAKSANFAEIFMAPGIGRLARLALRERSYPPFAASSNPQAKLGWGREGWAPAKASGLRTQGRRSGDLSYIYLHRTTRFGARTVPLRNAPSVVV